MRTNKRRSRARRELAVRYLRALSGRPETYLYRLPRILATCRCLILGYRTPLRIALSVVEQAEDRQRTLGRWRAS